MKYPGDILYFLKFVGVDIFIVSAAFLIIVLVPAWYFLRHKKKKDS